MDVVDPSHPSTRHLPSRWTVFDEVYNFKSDPRALGVSVIMTVDESTYTDPGPRNFDHGSPHPIAWYMEHPEGMKRVMHIYTDERISAFV
jgi:hypothetical protein